LNTFEATLHSGYLCLKVPATFNIITIFDSQKEARNINCDFDPGHKNMHFLREDAEQHEQAQPLSKQEISAEFKKAIQAKGDFRRVALDPKLLDKTVCVGNEMSLQEQVELLQFRDKNNDIVA
jgi:hypothetical protein